MYAVVTIACCSTWLTFARLFVNVNLDHFQFFFWVNNVQLNYIITIIMITKFLTYIFSTDRWWPASKATVFVYNGIVVVFSCKYQSAYIRVIFPFVHSVYSSRFLTMFSIQFDFKNKLYIGLVTSIDVSLTRVRTTDREPWYWSYHTATTCPLASLNCSVRGLPVQLAVLYNACSIYIEFAINSLFFLISVLSSKSILCYFYLVVIKSF